MQTSINLRTLHAASLCASTEQTRFYLGGVLIECAADHVIYAATDCHRMIAIRENLDTADKEYVPNTLLGHWIVPTETCRAHKIKKGWRARDHALLAKDGDISLRITGDEGVRVFTPIDGTFPDWRQVIPATLSGSTDEKGKDGKIEGVTFNPRYVSEFAKIGEILEAGNAQLAFNGTSPAGVVFYNENILAVLMPMRGDTQAELATLFAARKAFVRGGDL